MNYIALNFFFPAAEEWRALIVPYVFSTMIKIPNNNDKKSYVFSTVLIQLLLLSGQTKLK